MEIKENCLVVCEYPVMVSEDSNRIDTNLSKWEAYDSIGIDFVNCCTTEDIMLALRKMDRLGLHIMGTRGYVYRSKALADFLEQTDESVLDLLSRYFPRAFGLRDKIVEVAIK